MSEILRDIGVFARSLVSTSIVEFKEIHLNKEQ
ncbi:hypothetical protein IGI47_001528 [Enterococcus sp. AZ191]